MEGKECEGSWPSSRGGGALPQTATAARRCFCCWPSRNRWTPLLANERFRMRRTLEVFAEKEQRSGKQNRVFTYGWARGQEQDSSGTKGDDASRVIQAIADSSSLVLWSLAVNKSTCLLTQFSPLPSSTTTLCEKQVDYSTSIIMFAIATDFSCQLHDSTIHRRVVHSSLVNWFSLWASFVSTRHPGQTRPRVLPRK